MEKKKQLYILIGCLIFSFWFVSIIGTYAIKYFELHLTKTILCAFILFLLVFHLFAFLLRKKRYLKESIRIIEYIFLFTGVFGLYRISNIESKIAEYKAEYSAKYNKKLLIDIKRIPYKGIKEYSLYTKDEDIHGYSADYLIKWLISANCFIEKEYNKENWEIFIVENKKLFNEKSFSNINLLLIRMEEYIEENKKYTNLIAKSGNKLNFKMQYFGFWYLAYALALIFTKQFIEFMGWVKE